MPVSHPADLALRKAERGEQLSADDAYALTSLPDDDLDALCEVAAALRTDAHGRTLTYSPKAFLPVTNLCRDRCTYCTFRRDPGDAGEWTMSPEEIADWSRRGRELGCVEALMCLGDKPEVAFRGFRDLLRGYGAAGTVQYVHTACGIALAEGLLPHTNAGVLTSEEMALLRPRNVSMGLMLENISARLRDRGMPHQYAPDKDPGRRMKMIAEAGRLRIPFTSGILIGIGENEAERVASLLALRDVHLRYGHIQEIIVQSFRAKPSTPMAAAADCGEAELLRTVALARVIFGAAMSVQAPPNLSPSAHRRLIRAGINDWGGISPLTMDYVNPEAPWPHLDKLAETCRAEGFTLAPRLPVYEGFVNEAFLDPAMLCAVERMRQDRDADREALAI